MSVFKRIETYVVSLLVGLLSHWLAGHPGVVDPFVTGTLTGAIVHAIHTNGDGANHG